MSNSAVVAIAAVLVLASGCGDTVEVADPPTVVAQDGPSASHSGTSAPPTPTKQPAEKPSRSPRGTRIAIDDSPYGPMLFDARGQAIYLFDVETSSEPRCYGECAVAWPPVLTSGEPVAGPGVRHELLGTTERRDGTTQLTYGGHPLYFYVNEGPGEVGCHDVFLNGGYWYVVQPDGTRAP